MAQQEIALIVGAGAGLSASLGRLFNKEGMKVALASRDTNKLSGLVKEIDGHERGR
jgi:NADP-dependent 3-hydroxy acid dehydrogenase YdfG